jgi:hypothetical protein
MDFYTRMALFRRAVKMTSLLTPQGHVSPVDDMITDVADTMYN